MKSTTAAILSFSLTAFFPSESAADSFGIDTNSFEIDFVPIRNPNNPSDDNPVIALGNFVGSVGYEFRMAKYEISESMIDTANDVGNLGISYFPFQQGGWGPNKPVSGLSWEDAAKFVNWLNTSSGHHPAYSFSPNGNFQLWQTDDDGYNALNPYRNLNAFYFLPNLNEWHKAAFYDPETESYYNYATGSDIVPTAVQSGTNPNTAVYSLGNAVGPADITEAGGLSPYGTMAQNGNINELLETELDLVNDSSQNTAMIARGGMYVSQDYTLLPTWYTFIGRDFKSRDVGIRVASRIPEPRTGQITCAVLVLACSRMRFKLQGRDPHQRA